MCPKIVSRVEIWRLKELTTISSHYTACIDEFSGYCTFISNSNIFPKFQWPVKEKTGLCPSICYVHFTYEKLFLLCPASAACFMELISHCLRWNNFPSNWSNMCYQLWSTHFGVFGTSSNQIPRFSDRNKPWSVCLNVCCCVEHQFQIFVSCIAPLNKRFSTVFQADIN